MTLCRWKGSIASVASCFKFNCFWYNILCHTFMKFSFKLVFSRLFEGLRIRKPTHASPGYYTLMVTDLHDNSNNHVRNCSHYRDNVVLSCRKVVSDNYCQFRCIFHCASISAACKVCACKTLRSRFYGCEYFAHVCRRCCCIVDASSHQFTV